MNSCFGERNEMSFWASRSDRQNAGLSTAPPPASLSSGRRAARWVTRVRRAESSKFFGFASRHHAPSREHSAPLSVILITAGRSLPVKAGHALADYEYPDPNVLTFTGLGSSPRVYLHSTTNTQDLPSYRLTILPSQSARMHVTNE